MRGPIWSRRRSMSISPAYGVLAATGELTAKDLNLGVQTYDPTAYYNLVKDAPVAQQQAGAEAGQGFAGSRQKLKPFLTGCVKS